MKKTDRTRVLCFAAVSAVLMVFGAVCLVLALRSEYDAQLGLFTESSLFAPVLYCIICAGAVVGIVEWILFKKKESVDRPLPQSPAYIAVSALSALAILAETGISAVNTLGETKKDYAVIQYIVWCCAVVAAASLLYNMFSDGKVSRVLGSFLAFFPPLYCAGRVLIMYFDKSIAVNSPIKLMFQLAFLSFMLMFTCEAGLSLGRGGLFCRYMFTLSCSLTVGGAVMLGSLFYSLTNSGVFLYSLVEILSGLCLWMYSAVRLIYITRVELCEKAKKPKAAAEAPEENEYETN